MGEFKALLIKHRFIIRLTSILAICGLTLVMVTILLNLTIHLESDIRTIMFVVGFTLMLLGTLWKVVMEMNQE